MTASGLAFYQAALERLAESSRLRSLVPRQGLDFTSNDYLGLAASPCLGRAVTAAIARGTPVGAGGSRLLRGNAPEHEALEARAAAFFHAERALFFGSGYVANYALLSTLPQSGDFLVLDALVHASAHEGARADAFQTALEARAAGLRTELELGGRSLKGQLKHAERLGARFVAIHRPDSVVLRDRVSGTEHTLAREEVAKQVWPS